MKTNLYNQHQKNGAKFVDFAGWEMPLSYEGIIPEYRAVRNAVGLFDVSHMGLIEFTGKDTVKFLDFISTNTIKNKSVNKAIYTVLCDDTGVAIDDVIIYVLTNEHAFMIVNASNRQNVLNHLQKIVIRYQVLITPHFSDFGLIALQGPLSSQLVQKLYPETDQLLPKQLSFFDDLYISRTGYTGEDGFEFYGPKQSIESLWEKLTIAGKPFNLHLCGLGARDLLRLEMGYALYGHELSLNILPIESVAAWTVKLQDHDFLGKQAQVHYLKNKTRRYAIGLIGIENVPARENYPIYLNNACIGHITSGSFSPLLNRPIALGLVNQMLPLQTIVQIEIREKLYSFQIIKLPFKPKEGLQNALHRDT